ncbi:MAG: quinol:electron acceptor oxidoreductase subunit ActD [Ignavibacteriaceae bacterium]|jgi:mono/diheme cytochrome c family protein
MSERKLFGLTALFQTPDEIIHAAAKVHEAGYKKYDVHTPYPVHGMDAAMKLKPSNLGFVTLIFGLFGAAFALLFMYWAMSKDYPMIIGGKPFFALPAFIPITFEVTVLLATLATVIGMLTFYFKFPNNSQPLHDTPYMKAVSSDKYGVCIEANDELFDPEKVRNLFKELNGQNISEVYFPIVETFKIFEPKYLTLLVVVALLTSATTYLTLNKLLYITPFTWLMQQDRVNVQSRSTFYADGFGMRNPVEGTVARGFIPYEYKGLAAPVVPLSNPLMPSSEVLKLGKKRFLTFCSPCHGNYGDGDSRLRGQFPNPPSLHSEKVRGWQDGNIYHVITNGQNIMPSYASQLSRDERWAIIHYIRALQKAKNASPSEIIEAKKETSSNVAQ